MRVGTFLTWLAFVAANAGCAIDPLTPSTPLQIDDKSANWYMVSAQPDRGFQFPYLLRFPQKNRLLPTPFLLVEPNNSGHVSTDFDEHVGAAIALSRTGVGGDVSRRMDVPFLMPVFPRTEALYTHSLNRQTLSIDEPKIRRLDLQLVAMINDAQRRLTANGTPVNRKVFLSGFSASGMFVTRFAAIHPDRVCAVAAGGVNGFVILPLDRLGPVFLRYPLGIGDLSSLSGSEFNMSGWRQIRQFIFMGEKDTNDAVQFDDAYPPAERKLIFEILGETMIPDRWETCQSIYRSAGATVKFKTYSDMGHGTNGRIHNDISAFFCEAAAGCK